MGAVIDIWAIRVDPDKEVILRGTTITEGVHELELNAQDHLVLKGTEDQGFHKDFMRNRWRGKVLYGQEAKDALNGVAPD